MRTRTMLLAANKKYNAYVHDLEDCYISFYRHCMEDYIDYKLDRVDVDDIVDKVPISMWLPTSRTKELRDKVPSPRALNYWHRGDTYSSWFKRGGGYLFEEGSKHWCQYRPHPLLVFMRDRGVYDEDYLYTLNHKVSVNQHDMSNRMQDEVNSLIKTYQAQDIPLQLTYWKAEEENGGVNL